MNTSGDSPEDAARAWAAMGTESVRNAAADLAAAINVLRERLEDVEEFRKTVIGLGGHTATNVAKDDRYQFATVRNGNAYAELIYGMKNYKRVSVIRECVVFDDNQTLDSGWCGCDCGIKVIDNG